MPVRIILLETSTSLCSAALLEGDEITAVRHSGEPRAHASMTAPYVKEILDERGLRVSDCDAVCLSMGPGSYTGLRVGSSTAKGLCFGGGIPLLAVGTLDVLAAQAIEAGLPEGCEYIVPMIDARRMEVYTALYSADGQRITEVAPKVVDSSFIAGIRSSAGAPATVATLGSVRGRGPSGRGREAASSEGKAGYFRHNMDYKNIYFIGIGGIGMSALARYFKFTGYSVSGYDRTATTLTRQLESEGIEVHYEDNTDYIPKDKDATLVVYTPAIPEDMGELVYVLKGGYNVLKRSRILGEITRGQKCLAVAGTHGKTTTSTLVAHIIHQSGIGCSAFLGGISRNYGTNLIVSHTPTVVAEADEFDRSFLQLFPEIAVITAMDADHLDIYGTHEEYCKAFKTFASQVSRTVIVKKGLDITPDDTKAKILTYSYDNPSADFYAVGARPDELGHYIFDIVYPGGMIKDVRCGIPGWVNVENSVAAAAVCLTQGLLPDAVKESIGSFLGVKRRLDVHVASPKLTYIDDYAHHPRELSSAISSIKAMYPGRKLTAIFQPHLFTRTRDFASEFAESLSAVDKLILLDIYPAREEPIPGVTSEIIFDKVTAPEKVLLKKEELMEYIKDEPLDVLATFGAGNIDRFIEPIAEMLEERLRK